MLGIQLWSPQKGLEEDAEYYGTIEEMWLALGLVRASMKEELSFGLAKKVRESGRSQRSSVWGCQKPGEFSGVSQKPPVSRVCGQTLLVPPILTPGPAQMPEKGACMTALVSLSGNKTL